MKRILCCAVLGGLLVWLAGCASFNALSGGSVPIGDVDGNVYYSTRATTPARVTVELRDASGELLQQKVSGPDGYFFFSNVPVGVVEVIASEGALSGQVRFNRNPNEHARLALTVAEVNMNVAKLNVRSAKPEEPDGSVTLEEDEENLFTVEAEDAGSQIIPDVPVSWAVIGGLGDIAPEGTFEAKKTGDGELIVQHDGVSKHVPLHVNPKDK
ncbi:MAG: hypothetical protein ACYDCO_22235 [Armatimonadota bacterium]